MSRSRGEQSPEGDRLARRNALILAGAQAFYFIGATIHITLSGLVGHLLADDKSLATLPVSIYVLGNFTTTIPASLLMRRMGRRFGFQLGAFIGVISGCLAAYAIFIFSFWLFCAAIFLAGIYQAFSLYYRFAAADTASSTFKPTAISWVLAGGLIAAFIGPQIVIYTKDSFAPVLYAATYVAYAIAGLLAIGVLSLLNIPIVTPANDVNGQGRPLREILRQAKLRIAILTGMVSYASMIFIMTATPLAMVACNLSVDSAALAIQWHVIAMFAPSFFTGALIQRFGRERIIFAGLLLLGCAGLVGMTGLQPWQFNTALILLGIGWNFGYIGSTTMVTDCHRPEERGKVQAVNEFLVFGFVALASFSSGALLHLSGWYVVTMAYLPFVALAAGFALLLDMRQRAQSALGH